MAFLLELRFKLAKAVLLLRDESIDLLALPLLVHKPVQDIDLDEMNDEDEKPDRDDPGIPDMGQSELEEMIGHESEEAADKEEHEMKIQVLLLPEPFARIFVLFVLDIFHLRRFSDLKLKLISGKRRNRSEELST